MHRLPLHNETRYAIAAIFRILDCAQPLLHEVAVAGVFVLLMLIGDDGRRNEALAKLLFRSRDGIQYVEHAEGHGDKMFAAACDLGLEGIVSKSWPPPIGRGRRKPRAVDGTF